MLLYKYRSFDRLDFIADILVNQRLYCSNVRDLNDPFEGSYRSSLKLESDQSTHGLMAEVANEETKQPLRKLSYTITQDQGPHHNSLLRAELEKYKVCSLSASSTDVRLWSFYGGAHSGVAIEVELEVSESPDTTEYGLFKVETHPSLKVFHQEGGASHTMPKGNELLRAKTEIWGYEKEFRIINGTNYYDVRGNIKRVITGANFDRDNYAVIKRLAGDIPIVGSKLNTREIAVEVLDHHPEEAIAKNIADLTDS